MIILFADKYYKKVLIFSYQKGFKKFLTRVQKYLDFVKIIFNPLKIYDFVQQEKLKYQF